MINHRYKALIQPFTWTTTAQANLSICICIYQQSQQTKLSLNILCLITVVLHCRSHRRVDDTPRFTPTHKYNVWEDDRRSTGATPRFSKGKRKNLTGVLHHFTYRKFSKMMKLCMLCLVSQLSVGIKCKIIFGLSTDCHLQYITDRLPERQLHCSSVSLLWGR